MVFHPIDTLMLHDHFIFTIRSTLMFYMNINIFSPPYLGMIHQGSAVVLSNWLLGPIQWSNQHYGLVHIPINSNKLKPHPWLQSYILQVCGRWSVYVDRGADYGPGKWAQEQSGAPRGARRAWLLGRAEGSAVNTSGTSPPADTLVGEAQQIQTMKQSKLSCCLLLMKPI